MKKERFYEVLENTEAIYDSEIYELKELIDKYPYFQQSIFLYLRALYNSNFTLYQNELARLTGSINNRIALFYFVFEKEYREYFEKTAKKKISKSQTDKLINAFFESKPKDEVESIDYNIASKTLASADYFSYLKTENSLKDRELIPMKHQSIIDKFIKESSKDGGLNIHLNDGSKGSYIPKQNEEEILEDNAFFTETLAKIYIKQKRYEKAYEIIKHLSLNFKEKNPYFADQLDFLEKLIINSKQKRE